MKWLSPIPWWSGIITYFLPQSLRFILPLMELVLGLWLLSLRWKFGASLAAVVTFLTFASYSCYLGLIGQPTCGCMGNVKLHPWYTFAFDLFAVLLLALVRPRPERWPVQRRSLRLAA